MARDGWRHREPLKRLTHKTSFATTYSGLWQEGRVDLEMLEESLGLVALGRKLKAQTPGSLC